jgi:hypothetical protein
MPERRQPLLELGAQPLVLGRKGQRRSQRLDGLVDREARAQRRDSKSTPLGSRK